MEPRNPPAPHSLEARAQPRLVPGHFKARSHAVCRHCIIARYHSLTISCSAFLISNHSSSDSRAITTIVPYRTAHCTPCILSREMFASCSLARQGNAPRAAVFQAGKAAQRGTVKATAFLGLGGATATGGMYDIAVKVREAAFKRVSVDPVC